MYRRSVLAKRWVVVLAAAFLAADLLPQALHADFEPPPPPKPHRRSAGESFPPLPLPATPLRRTEKKRQPAPPALIGKIIYGKPMWMTTEDGRRFSYNDWQSDTTDLHHLLKWCHKKLGIRYRYIELPLKSFSYDPAELPVLFMTGHEDFVFNEQEIKGLRQYIRDGGSFFCDCCCGSNRIGQAFEREMLRVFPNRPLKVIPPDHPLYSCFYEIRATKLREQGGPWREVAPNLEGLSFGCRLAVVLSRYDVSCGWAHHEHPQGKRVHVDDAVKLGTNFVAYALANYQLGRALSTETVYFDQADDGRDELVFAQVIHGGDWDPDPSAVMHLLKFAARQSTLDVRFKRADIDLRKVDAFRYPFLYITGHDDFVLTDQEVTALRSYLRTGGVLIADACCGRRGFDTAFRRELKRVLVKHDLELLKPDHPVYDALFKIRQVHYTDWLAQNKAELKRPMLEGITIGGSLAVIYSRYDLGCGWEGHTHPYALGVKSHDALRLGTNCIVYALTH